MINPQLLSKKYKIHAIFNQPTPCINKSRKILVQLETLQLYPRWKICLDPWQIIKICFSRTEILRENCAFGPVLVAKRKDKHGMRPRRDSKYIMRKTQIQHPKRRYQTPCNDNLGRNDA